MAKSSSKKRKIAAGATAVALVAVLGAAGTYSYLQDETGTVTNSFNPNTVKVSLTETNSDGEQSTSGNNYDILPGTVSKKDPKVTVTTDVAAYVFVDVTDNTGGLVSYSIADGWTQYGSPTTNEDRSVTTTYYRSVEGKSGAQTFSVLKDDQVKYASSLTNGDMVTTDGNGGTTKKSGLTLSFKSRAVQKEGMGDNMASAYYAAGVDVDDASDITTTISAANEANATSLTLDVTKEVKNASGLIVGNNGTKQATRLNASNFVFDLNNQTYTIANGPLAGSGNTYATQAFQLLKGNTVKMENGTLVADNSGIQMIIQNYADLTLDGMTIDATKGSNSVSYVVSNNNGNIVINDSTITAKTNGVALDVYSFSDYTGANVTLSGATKINGDVEVGYSAGANTSNLHLTIGDGVTITGKIKPSGAASNLTEDQFKSYITIPDGYELSGNMTNGYTLTKTSNS